MKYKYISDDKKFYQYIDTLINDGYKLVKHYFLAYLFKKQDDEILVSLLKIKKHQKLEELEQYNHKYEISFPDYSNTNLNLIAGIRRNFGFDYKYEVDDKIFDKKYDHIVLLLLDGLGKNVLDNNMKDDSFLKSHYFKSVNSIFPSTTACATTAIKAGREPIETGWTGWHNYFKEIEKDIILFTGENYYDSEDKDNKNALQMIPYQPFFSDLGFGGIYEPNFSHIDFHDTLERSLANIKKDKVQYVYHTEPDSLMHALGTYKNKIKKELQKIDKEVAQYAKKLPENTMLLVIADHGHIPVYKGIDFYHHKELMDMLETRPSNDTRCIVFRVKEGYKDQFKNTFNAYYEDIYDLYDTPYLIEHGFFGNKEHANPRIMEFLGDFVAIAKSDYLLYSKKDFNFKSHHAGYTKDEMIVPVIVYKK